MRVGRGEYHYLKQDTAGVEPLPNAVVHSLDMQHLDFGKQKHTNMCAMVNQGDNDPLLKPRERKAFVFIRNRLVHGLKAPTVRELAAHLGFSSPRSASVVIDRLIDLGFLARRESDRTLQILKMPVDTGESNATVQVPLVGSAPCGAPLLAVVNVEAHYPVSLKLAKPPHQYFLLRAVGTSMNRADIPDGSLVLVRHQQTADNGDIVVALVDDDATIKELLRSQNAAALVPRSDDPTHKPIVLTHDFQVQGVVVATVPDITE